MGTDKHEEPLCHNPLCPHNRQQLPKDEIAVHDVHYFCGPSGPIRFCPACTEAVRLVNRNPYGIRPEFFL